MPLESDADIRSLLEQTRSIALVGASANPERPSHRVMGKLIAHGYRVIPVNPGLAGQELMGQRVVARLAEAGQVDLVDIFRRSEDAGGRARGVDAAGRHQPRGCRARRGGGPSGRDGPLPGNRDPAAGCRPGCNLRRAACEGRA